jgi:hypothetical protein
VLASAFIPAAASAADKWDLEVSPVFFVNSTGDAGAPPQKGFIAGYCPGYNGVPVPPACPGNLQLTNNLRLDYGLTYHFNRRWSLQYTHTNLDFSIGRISSIAPLSLLTGDIDDRTDQGKLNYNAGGGLVLDGYYFSHQRSNIAATASNFYVAATGSNCYFNAIDCPGNKSNPGTINSNAWGVGATYSFGPHTRFEPPMFKLAVDAQYYPRPAAQGAASCIPPGFPGANAPVCSANGIPGYVGSQTTFPYALTMFPLSPLKHMPLGFLPFVAYERTVVLWRAENSPEMFNSTVWGFVQVLGHGLSVSYTNLHLNGCLCSDTVPPPDSIRFVDNILKVTYDIHF